MNNKIIFTIIFTLTLLMSGCTTEDDNQPASTAVAIQPLREVMVDINIPPGPIVSDVKCFDRDFVYLSETKHFNYSFFEYVDKHTRFETREGVQYRVRFYALRDTYLLIEETEWFKDYYYSFNDTSIEIQCKADLITPDNKITADVYDEGYKETLNINLWYRVDFTCRYEPSIDDITCTPQNRYRSSRSFTMDDAYEIEKKIIEKAMI